MTEQAPPAGFAAARDQLDTLCVKVGLTQAGSLPDLDAAAATPEGTTLWASAYARVVLWPCGASDAAAIEASARRGQAWFDEVLVQGERQTRGRPIDGYLVLALPATPDDAAREDVRRLELSAQVCRKHLIWPSCPSDPDHKDGRWRRVDDVTVLGLPDAEAAPGAELQWPEIDTEAKALWDDLASIGVSLTVAKDEAG